MKVKYPGSTQAPMPLDSYVIANPRDFTAYIIHTYKNSNNKFESKRYRDEIKSIKIETTGINGKFFGVSYCQKLSVSFIDKDKKINFSKNDEIAIFLCPTEKYNAPDADNYYNVAYAPYFVDSFKRNEKTGEVSAIGYDIMGVASNTPFSLGEGDSFTLQQILDRCKTLAGISGVNKCKLFTRKLDKRTNKSKWQRNCKRYINCNCRNNRFFYVYISLLD